MYHLRRVVISSGAPRSARARRRPALSLIELLVVLAIIGLLFGLLLAAVQRVRDSAARTTCQGRLRQMGLALHNYHDTHGALPPGCSYLGGRDPMPHVSWMARLLPYLEQESLWREAERAYQQDRFFEAPPHHPVLGRVVVTFTCPTDGRTRQPRDFGTFQVALTSYQGVAGFDRETRDGVFYLDSRTRLADITDGTSTTLAVGERPPSADYRFGWWYAGWGQRKDGSLDSVLGVRERNFAEGYGRCPRAPYDYQAGRFDGFCDVFHFWSPHLGGGANFLFADGAVRFVRYSANDLMPALASRAGREPVMAPD